MVMVFDFKDNRNKKTLIWLVWDSSSHFSLLLMGLHRLSSPEKAYQYTSLTSVMLLDCWAIPCVLVLTWAFLKTNYRMLKISGVVICIVGVVMVVFSDVHAGDRAEGSNPVKGDSLVIAGATLYAVSNAGEDFFVKNTADTIELMAFMGIFEAYLNVVNSKLFTGQLKLFFLSFRFALTMFLFYSLVPVLLKTNGSTMFNLSLLTSDMWAGFDPHFCLPRKGRWAYYLAFATTAIGLIIYSIKEKDQEDQRNGQVPNEELLC